MSLDVQLVTGEYDLSDKKTFNEYELRHLAVNFAIHSLKGGQISFEEWYSGISNSWVKIANQDNPRFYESDYKETLYEANITHNLGEMASQAGIYEALWRPEEIGCFKAKDIVLLLEMGLISLKNKPEHYKKFNSPNGWGLYKHFVPFVEKYLEACKENPNSIIEVSR